MDRNLAEQYKKMKIGIDDLFKFHCTQCGKCCINRDDILLTPRDLFRISQKLNLTPQETVQKYCESYIGDDSRLPIVRIKPVGIAKRCPLLRENKCTVHDAKPSVCAMFPIGRVMELSPDNANEEHMGYIFVNPECGDNKETHTVREWFNNFNIPLKDTFFMEWSKMLVDLGNILQYTEKKVSFELMSELWSAILIILYLNYDMELPFLPQFQAHCTECLSLMRLFQPEPRSSQE